MLVDVIAVGTVEVTVMEVVEVIVVPKGRMAAAVTVLVVMVGMSLVFHAYQYTPDAETSQWDVRAICYRLAVLSTERARTENTDRRFG